jgi:hypothetical protein
MKAWYFPSWNGDLRLEPEADSADKTRLSIVEPTAHEQIVLTGLEKVFREKGWWKGDEPIYAPPKGWFKNRQTLVGVTIDAPLSDIGPLVARHLKPGISTLTAIKFEGGKIYAVEGVESELTDAVRIAMGGDPSQGPYREAAKPAAPPPAPPPKPVVAATVQRPTPCCPRCIPGAVEPATEVLLSFLSDEQHESWSKDRCLIAVGGFTGARYLLAHRHTPRAQKIGRVCYSLDDEAVVHFHQTEVPPEEEILAALLILEQREHWLRNEATLFDFNPDLGRFKNPFGDDGDGTWDAAVMDGFGIELMGRRSRLTIAKEKAYSVAKEFYAGNVETSPPVMVANPMVR